MQTVIYAPTIYRHIPSWPVWLFFLFAVMPVILPINVFSLLLALSLFFVFYSWVMRNKTFPSEIFAISIPFIMIIMTGFHGVLSNDRYDFGKDIWYIGNAWITLLSGYMLMLNLRDLKRLMQAFFLAGGAVALFHLQDFIRHPEVLLLTNVQKIREEAGHGYLMPCVSVVLFIMARLCHLKLFNWLWVKWLVFALCLASLSLSFSRTWYLVTLILVAAIFGWIDPRNHGLNFALLLGCFAISVTLLIMFAPPYESLQKGTLLEKFMRIPHEITIQSNYSTTADIYTNWRGYESQQALKTYLKGNFLEYFFGQGFGTGVNLDIYVLFLGEGWNKIASGLHNAYMELLVKTGVIGILWYLLLLAFLIHRGYHYSQAREPSICYVGRLLVGFGFVFLLTTAVVSGMFSKTSFIGGTMLTGALLAYLRIEAKKMQMLAIQKSIGSKLILS